MRRILLIAIATLFAAIVLVARTAQADPTDQSRNLIKNGMFERWVSWDDVTVGENWAPWVISGSVKFGANAYEHGQQIQNERGGFVAGLYQEIPNVKPGAQYFGYVGTASLYWGNQEGKFEEVGRTVGIDPTGGTNPRSPNIVWGNTTFSNKRWEFKDDPNAHAPKVRAIARSTRITFFLKVEFHRGDNFNQTWLTDAAVFLDTENPTGTATPLPALGTSQVTGNLPTAGAAPAAPAQPSPGAAGGANPTAPSRPPEVALGPNGTTDVPIRDGSVEIGRFFSQTAKNGLGYTVADRGTDRNGNITRWWSEFGRLGGVDSLGYPISKPFLGQDGFLYQAFQRGVLQWRPELSQATLANSLDWLSDAGKDDWAYERALPRAIRDDGSNGDYAKAVQTRIGWMTEPAIARRYREGPDPQGQPVWALEQSIALYGLPSSRPERIGPFIVQRFQRVAFQYWVDDAPGGPPRGSVVPILAGDLLAEAFLIPADARAPETPPR